MICSRMIWTKEGEFLSETFVKTLLADINQASQVYSLSCVGGLRLGWHKQAKGCRERRIADFMATTDEAHLFTTLIHKQEKELMRQTGFLIKRTLHFYKKLKLTSVDCRVVGKKFPSLSVA